MAIPDLMTSQAFLENRRGWRRSQPGAGGRGRSQRFAEPGLSWDSNLTTVTPWA